MQINGDILLYQLSQYFDVAEARCSNHYPVSHALYYNAFFPMTGCAIIFSGEDLPKAIPIIHHCVIICLEPPGDSLEIGDNDLIVLSDPISHQIIFNILATIFQLFEKWHQSLFQILHSSMDFHALLETTQQVLPAPLSLSDQEFKYVAYTDDSVLTLTHYIDEANYLPMENISSLTTAPGFGESQNRREAYVFSADNTVVTRNIFCDDQCVGRLNVIVLDDDAVEVAYKKAIFNILGPFVEEIYTQSRGFDITPPSRLHLRQLLEDYHGGKPVDPASLLHALGDNGYAPGDTLQGIAFTLNATDRVAYNLAYLQGQMERQWPGACCLSFEDSLLLLLNNSDFKRCCPDRDFRSELSYFLRENLLRAGLSRSFVQPLQFLAAWKQARYILTRGQEAAPSRWVHTFDEDALNCLLDLGIHTFPPELVCHPGLLALIQHDEKQGTAFFTTLAHFIRHRYNASATATALYIHRNSFIGRMDRIRELIELDLEDLDERLYLELSLRILEESITL